MLTRSPASWLRQIFLLVVLCSSAAAAPARAVIIDYGDGAGNLDPPPAFPHWRNVDQRFGGTSVIYLGRGWVLTARHVGAGIVVFDGQRYSPDPGTLTHFGDPDGPADLLLFRLSSREPWPDLPMLEIAARPPRAGEPVLMIGNGRNRDARIRARSPTGRDLAGWAWATTTSKRWGTNRVIGGLHSVVHDGTSTRAFSTRFDSLYDGGATEYEAQAAEGDSGGAVFARRDHGDPRGDWVLAGVMFTVHHPHGGSVAAAYYGDLTHSVDLSTYRAEILARVRPECVTATDDGPVERPDAPADCGWERGAARLASGAHVERTLETDVRVLRDAALLPGGALLDEHALLRRGALLDEHALLRGGPLLDDDALLRGGASLDDDALRRDDSERRERALRAGDEAAAGGGGSTERTLSRAAWAAAGLVFAAGLAALVVTLASRRPR